MLYALYGGLKNEKQHLYTIEHFADIQKANAEAYNYALAEYQQRENEPHILSHDHFVSKFADNFLEHYINHIEGSIDYYAVPMTPSRHNKPHVIYHDDGDYFPEY